MYITYMSKNGTIKVIHIYRHPSIGKNIKKP